MIVNSEVLNQLYINLADSLNISESKTEEIISSYKAVGMYLGNLETELGITIFPQGSLNLGTVIKPLKSDRNGSYDIDLVCKLEGGYYLSAEEVKNIIGKRLKESSRYSEKLDEEGKRCWTLNYADFHMDILPCIPNDTNKQSTVIKITEKNDDDEYNFSLSNPKGYKKWFVGEMQSVFNESRSIYAQEKKVEIEDVKLFKLRTPLQMAIQILKRHRDIMFENKQHKPISIILTTLAARAYNGETNVFDAISNIISNMENYICINDKGEYEICNPTNNEENFADRWNENPDKPEAFVRWLKKAKKDIIEDPLEFVEGLPKLKEQFEVRFGSEVALETFNRYGEMMGNRSKNEELGVTKNGHITTQVSKVVMPIRKHTFYGGGVE